MFAPTYLHSISLVSGSTKIMGNLELANKIEKLTREYITQGKNLYQSQESIKAILIKEYGDEWYNKSGEAINYIIENEYANIERKKSPIFDKKQYEYDMKHGVLY